MTTNDDTGLFEKTRRIVSIEGGRMASKPQQLIFANVSIYQVLGKTAHVTSPAAATATAHIKHSARPIGSSPASRPENLF
jgi:hypothetical protein